MIARIQFRWISNRELRNEKDQKKTTRYAWKVCAGKMFISRISVQLKRVASNAFGQHQALNRNTWCKSRLYVQYKKRNHTACQCLLCECNRALKTGQLYLPRGIKRHVDTRINLSAAGHASREGVKKSLHFPIGI